MKHSSDKINEVISEPKTLEIQVAISTETKNKGQGSVNLGQYDHFHGGVSKEKREQQRVSILLSKKLKIFITSGEPMHQRKNNKNKLNVIWIQIYNIWGVPSKRR